MAAPHPAVLAENWRELESEKEIYDELGYWKGTRKERVSMMLDTHRDTLKSLKTRYDRDEAVKIRGKLKNIGHELLLWKAIINSEIERNTEVYTKRHKEMKLDDDDDRSKDVWRLQTLGKAPSVHDPDQFLIDLNDEEYTEEDTKEEEEEEDDVTVSAESSSSSKRHKSSRKAAMSTLDDWKTPIDELPEQAESGIKKVCETFLATAKNTHARLPGYLVMLAYLFQQRKNDNMITCANLDLMFGGALVETVKKSYVSKWDRRQKNVKYRVFYLFGGRTRDTQVWTVAPDLFDYIETHQDKTAWEDAVMKILARKTELAYNPVPPRKRGGSAKVSSAAAGSGIKIVPWKGGSP